MGIQNKTLTNKRILDYFECLGIYSDVKGAFFYMNNLRSDEPETSHFDPLYLYFERVTPTSNNGGYNKVAVMTFRFDPEWKFIKEIYEFDIRLYAYTTTGSHRFLSGETEEVFNIKDCTRTHKWGDNLLYGDTTRDKFDDAFAKWREEEWVEDEPIFWGWMPNSFLSVRSNLNPGKSAIVSFSDSWLVNNKFVIGQIYNITIVPDEVAVTSFYGIAAGSGGWVNYDKNPTFDLNMDVIEPERPSDFTVVPHPDDPSVAVFSWKKVEDTVGFHSYGLFLNPLPTVYPSGINRRYTGSTRPIWEGKDIDKEFVCVNLFPDGSDFLMAPYKDCKNVTKNNLVDYPFNTGGVWAQPAWTSALYDGVFSLYAFNVVAREISNWNPAFAVGSDYAGTNSIWGFDLYSRDGVLSVRIPIPQPDMVNSHLIDPGVMQVGQKFGVNILSFGHGIAMLEVDWGDNIITKQYYDFDDLTDDYPTDVSIYHYYGKSGTYTPKFRVYNEDGFATRWSTVNGDTFVINPGASSPRLIVSPSKFTIGKVIVLNGALSYIEQLDRYFTKFRFCLDYNPSLPGSGTWYDNGLNPILEVDTASPPSPLVFNPTYPNIGLELTDNIGTNYAYIPYTLISGAGSTVDNPIDGLGLSYKTRISRRRESFGRNKTVTQSSGGYEVETDSGLQLQRFSFSAMSVRDELHQDLETMRTHIDNDDYIMLTIYDEPGVIIEVTGKVTDVSITRTHHRIATWEFNFTVYKREVITL